MGALRAKFREGPASRLLSQQAAEAYCSMSLEMFHARFGKRIPALPSRDGEKFYDRHMIDKIIEEISAGASAHAPRPFDDRERNWLAAEAERRVMEG